MTGTHEEVAAEAEMLAREAEIRATLYSIGDAVISADLDGRVTRMNRVAEQLTGWSESEAVGRALEEVFVIVNEETRRQVESPVTEVLRQGQTVGLANHTLLISRSGAEVPIADSGAPIVAPHGMIAGVVMVFRDQTEERMAHRLAGVRIGLIEYAIQHTLDELLTRALDEVGAVVDSPIGFYHFVEPDQRTISLQQWSTTTVRDFCTAEAKGMSYCIDDAGVWVDCVRERRPVVHNDYASLPNKQGMPDGHARVIRELVIPVMREGRVVAILGVGNKPSDYTDKDVEAVSFLADETWEIVSRKRGEEALRQVQERYEKLFTSMTDGCCLHELVHDDAGKVIDYRIVDVNPRYEAILGLERAQVMGKLASQVYGGDQPPYLETYAKVAKTGEPEQFETYFPPMAKHFRIAVFSPGKDAFATVFQDITQLKSAIQAVGESEAKLRSIFRAAPVGIGVVSERVLLDVNQRFCELTGFATDEAVGRSTRFLYPTDEEFESAGREKYRQIEETGTGSVETRFRRKDGSIINVLMGSTPLDASDLAAGVTFTVLDITERRRAEEALRESEAFLRNLLDAIPNPVYYKDREGRYLGFNRAFETFFGAPREELVGRTSHDFNPREVADHFDQKDAELFEQGGVQRYESRVRNADGELRDVIFNKAVFSDSKGAVCGLIGAILDISDRKRSEEDLKEAVLRQNEAVKAAKVGLWDWDLASNSVRYSAEWKRQIGYEDHEISDDFEEFRSRVHPDDLEHLQERVQRSIAEGLQDHQVEFRFRHRDGSYRWILAQGSVLKDRQGRPVRMLGSHVDITEPRRAEEERAHLEEQFRQAQKLESIGRLAGGVAHDLNNLLSPILGYSDLLLEGAAEGDPSRDHLEQIVNAAERARDLVRQLLAFSRKQTLEFKPVDLNALLKGFERLLRRAIREDVAIQMELAPSLPYIQGDVGQLEQVVMNLAVNAQDAMQDGGTLSIETAMVELDEAFSGDPEGVIPGPHVQLVISDTGCGMDEETRQHVFEPFFTTKAQDQGTGLGLPTVYGIVRQHGGYIWVYSEVGTGTIFKIYLPVSAQAGAADRREPSLPAADHGTETILLVEDNEQVRNLALAILVSRGYDVLEAAGGAEALALLKASGGPVHLLLTDVVMPEMNGKELFARVSGLHPGARVLYMSGYSDDVIAHRGVIDEDVNFIQKPFSVKALAAKVRAVLDQ